MLSIFFKVNYCKSKKETELGNETVKGRSGVKFSEKEGLLLRGYTGPSCAGVCGHSGTIRGSFTNFSLTAYEPGKNKIRVEVRLDMLNRYGFPEILPIFFMAMEHNFEYVFAFIHVLKLQNKISRISYCRKGRSSSAGPHVSFIL